jgi:hypothetical protein
VFIEPEEPEEEPIVPDDEGVESIDEGVEAEAEIPDLMTEDEEYSASQLDLF